MSASMKVAIVGQAPGRNGDRETPLSGKSVVATRVQDWFEPFLELTNTRLLNVVDEYPGATESGDRLPRSQEARKKADSIASKYDVVVCLGSFVTRAFGLRYDPCTRIDVRSVTYLIAPHPSGRNRYLNGRVEHVRHWARNESETVIVEKSALVLV